MTLVLFVLAAAATLASGELHSTRIDAAIGAILGGGTGNLLDGFNRQAVTDFIDLRLWPVFNLADAAIVGGAAVMLMTLMR